MVLLRQYRRTDGSEFTSAWTVIGIEDATLIAKSRTSAFYISGNPVVVHAYLYNMGTVPPTLIQTIL